MGLKILRQRHRTAPAMNGCRWCGFMRIDHANRWVPSQGWHEFAEPTDTQRRARYLAGSGLHYPATDRVPRIVTNQGTASHARTRL